MMETVSCNECGAHIDDCDLEVMNDEFAKYTCNCGNVFVAEYCDEDLD